MASAAAIRQQGQATGDSVEDSDEENAGLVNSQ